MPILSCLACGYHGVTLAPIAENGLVNIIKRELFNHECFYTLNIEPVFLKLADYGITIEEIREEFNKLNSPEVRAKTL